MSDLYLIHHGIEGQKWGDRNGPPYPLGSSDHSSTEKKAGTSGWSDEAKSSKILKKNSQEAIKKIIKNDFKSNKKIDSVMSSRKKELDKHYKENELSFDDQLHNTDKAKKFYDDERAIIKKYSDLKEEAYSEYRKELSDTVKEVMKSPEISNSINEAIKNKDILENAENKYISENSEYAKKAYKKYVSQHGGKSNSETEYGFYHYNWGRKYDEFGNENKEYIEALSEYTKVTNSAQENYSKSIEEAGKIICDGCENKIISDKWGYKDTMSNHVQYLLNSDLRYFKDYR